MVPFIPSNWKWPPPNRSKLGGSSLGVSDGTREANCKLCLCASADWRWHVLASNRWADTRGFSWSLWNSRGSDDPAWWVLDVGGCYRRHSEQRRLAPSHRLQSLFRLLEFLCPFGDGLCFAGRFNVAEPHGLGPKDQDGPPNKCFVCHEAASILRRRSTLKVRCAPRQKRAKCPVASASKTAAKRFKSRRYSWVDSNYRPPDPRSVPSA
jgi:hypothetical protein